MKILIASKFFYNRGGAEVVAIGTKRLLEERGHEVRVFAMDYPDNLSGADKEYFPCQVDFTGSLGNKLKGTLRILGLGDVARKARQMIEDYKPDVVHLHNVHSYLSPLIGEIAHRHGARVVWTLHDYKLICPAYSFRRPDGTICQECLADKSALLRHRCMKNSLTASIIARIEAKVWNKHRLNAFTDMFITPSSFMGEKMKEGGFPADKITTLCNFVDPPKLKVLSALPVRERGDGYFCYIGRMSAEKGVPTLLNAADNAGVRLKLAGDGPLLESFREQYGANKNIEFLGKLNAEQVARLLSGADAMVISSECFENNPLSVIESLCAGTPVIGARIGGIPELVAGGNGMLFPSGDVHTLTRQLQDFDAAAFERRSIAEKARHDFCEETHYSKLLNLYKGDKKQA